MFGKIGITEILLVFALVMLMFGARKLPELGSGIGKGIKNFKRALKGEDEIDVSPKSGENENIK